MLHRIQERIGALFSGDSLQILMFFVVLIGVAWPIFIYYKNKKITKNNKITKGEIIDALGEMPPEEREPLLVAIDALYEIRREEPDKAKTIDKALALLRQGDTTEAEGVLRGHLEEKKRAGREALREAAAAARHLAAFVYLHDTSKALESYREATRLDPEELEGWLELGQAALRAGDSREALATFRELHRRAREQGDIRWRAIAHSQLGDMDNLHGDTAGALDRYQRAQGLLAQWAAREPNDPQRQRDLSVSHNKVGDMHKANGDGAKALAAYQEGLVIARKLTEMDPKNTEWQRDLSVSFDRVGDIYLANGDGAKALAAYQQGLLIARKLTEMDPLRVEWKTDIVASYVRMASMETDKARTDWLERALSILAPLAEEGRLPAKQAGWIPAIKEVLAD
uniref:TPR repeat-containing protein n=1 Tax=Candidatus Kentrum sp. SD TaxID=2126332 RepID=A0A450YFW6_9GAMM|nr:MAG: TPR repeat-containing protein [Candidatus Kentron sp. SD]VFK45892.1 MAG: TPR repeat-containing protein [Candidatus Kentron sp. SD]